MVIAGLVFYIVGLGVTAGVIGGVRDEMDGIADIAIILFWPLAAIVVAFAKAWCIFYALGRWVGRKPVKR